MCGAMADDMDLAKVETPGAQRWLLKRSNWEEEQIKDISKDVEKYDRSKSIWGMSDYCRVMLQVCC